MPDLSTIAEQLSQSERFVLGWLAREEWSQIGECKGAALDRLVELDLVREGPSDPRGDDYRCVGLNDTGFAVCEHLELKE